MKYTETNNRLLQLVPATLLPFASPLVARAQEDGPDESEGLSGQGGGRGLRGLTEEEDPFAIDDDILQLNLRRYMDEIIMLVLLMVVIMLVRHFMPPRDRRGCTFFVILFALILYVINKFLP